MKDIIKGFELPKIDAPLIHGEADIVLKNVKTGLVERIHSENTFQASVLAKHLNTYGEFGLPNGGWDYSNLVGGLLLFKNAIEVGSRFMPAGNKMQGHGYRGSVRQGDYSLLGTFNSSESSAGASAITQVYDYATDQANGTIGCIALTSLRGGQVGYGIGSNAPYSLYNFGDSVGANIGEDGGQGGFYNGYKYYVSSYSNGILTITKTPIDVLKGNIFRGLSKLLTFDLEELGITPKNVEPYWNVMGDVGGGKFRFWSEATANGISVASGGTIYYYEFDATTETLSQGTITNTSGETLQLANYGVQFLGDKCFIAYQNNQNSTNVFVFDVDNSTFLKKMTSCMNFAYHNGTYTSRIPCELSDDLYLLQGYSNGQYTFLYDAVADTTERMNLRANSDGTSSAYNVGAMTQLKNCEGVLKALSRQSNSSFYAWVSKNPLYLATINNLQSPVTKTAAQTMKVTYTLTEA